MTEQTFSSFIRKIYSWEHQFHKWGLENFCIIRPLLFPSCPVPVPLPKLPALDYVEISALLLILFSVLFNAVVLNFLVDSSLSDSGVHGLCLVSVSSLWYVGPWCSTYPGPRSGPVCSGVSSLCTKRSTEHQVTVWCCCHLTIACELSVRNLHQKWGHTYIAPRIVFKALSVFEDPKCQITCLHRNTGKPLTNQCKSLIMRVSRVNLDPSFKTCILKEQKTKKDLINCHMIFMCEAKFILAEEKTLSQMIAINLSVYRASYNTFMRENSYWCLSRKLTQLSCIQGIESNTKLKWNVKFFSTCLNISHFCYTRCLKIT